MKRRFERSTKNSSSHSSEQVIYRVGISLEVVCCCSNLPKEKKNRDFKLMSRALSQIGIYPVGTLPQVCSFRSEAYWLALHCCLWLSSPIGGIGDATERMISAVFPTCWKLLSNGNVWTGGMVGHNDNATTYLRPLSPMIQPLRILKQPQNKPQTLVRRMG